MTNSSPSGGEPRSRAHDHLLVVLAAAGAVILGLIVILITLDVLLRASGLQPLAHTLALSEYGLLYATLLGAPWLLRTHGHVHVEIVVAAVPPRARWLMVKTARLLGLIACLVVAWAASETAYLNFTRGAAGYHHGPDLHRRPAVHRLRSAIGRVAYSGAGPRIGSGALSTGRGGR